MTDENNNENLSFTQSLRKDNLIITDIPQERPQQEKRENELPILLIPNTILLPHTDMTIQLDKPHTENMLKTVNSENQGIILTPKRIPQTEGANIEFYDVGIILELQNLQEEPEQYQLELKVKDKVFVSEITETDGVFQGIYKVIEEEINLTEEESQQINKNINDAVLTISNLIPNSEIYAQQIIGKLDTLEKVAEVFPYIRVPIERKQELLEMKSAKLRALTIVQLLLEQKDAMILQMDIAKKLNKKMTETHKQSLLREQMKMIQEELDMTDETEDHKTYRERIMEENIIRNYLDTILTLPWHKEKGVKIDIQKAKEQLDKDHYGLEKVKERIIQHLTVLKMKEEKQGSILLLVGPPGTGKTSLGRSIAEALDRPYVRASLGGIKDESEIRGHRRTYLGALPGRIINGMKKAGKTNPVFVLDEIDKMTASINGNPTSALLEVLDPEQNDSFSDHYLEISYDLSDVFFIGTANSLSDIPGPLQDRLEIIELDSYTKVEKEHIAIEHLIDEVLENHGLTNDDLIITKKAITTLIEKYTREAGVRNLKRQIEAIARHTTEKIVVDDVNLPYIVTESMLYDILGHEKAHYELVPNENPAGVVTGLAWTPVGGDILYIEAALTPGEGKLKLTGKLGDVMKESAQIAQSLIKSRLSSVLKDSDYDEHDIHIHVPEGAIPKDGPSAGITMTTTLASLITGIPVSSTTAMTGEISLTGRVLPVGGIKEKVIAAHRSGIKTVLLPERNMKDLDDVPEEVKEELTFKPMKKIEDVLTEALNIKLPESESLNIDVSSLQQ